MPENKTSNQERIKEITDRIETGIREMFESEHYSSYLQTVSRFHKYSVNNTMLIYMQKPDATYVAGFNAWRDKFERYVKRGEKGIQILAPTPIMKKVKQAVLDPVTQAPVLDGDGKPLTEEKSVKIPMFKPVSVFDVSQTDGKPLPQLAQTLTGDVEHYEAFIEALRRSSSVPIEFESMVATMDGYFSAEKHRIAIRPGMSQVQTVAAIVHEIGHSKLHEYDRLQAAARDEGGKPPIVKDRRTEEVEAESIAYTVCQYFGIETAENSFGYIAAWSKDKELKELKASLDTIRQTSSVIISDVDRNYAELCKERGISQERSEEDEAKDAPTKEAEPAETSPVQPQAEALEKPVAVDTAVVAKDPYLAYANALCDHAEELYRAGLITPPFPDTKEQFAQEYAELLRSSGLRNAKAVLDDFAEQSGYPTPKVLYQQIEALKKLWENSMTYELHTSELDPNVSYITSFTPTGEVDEGLMFSGPTAVCEKLLRELREGTITLEQARAMNRQWNHILPPGPSEALYLVEDKAFVHLQITDAGYDYTVYDAITNALLDGGQFSIQNSEMHRSARTLMEGALLEVCVIQGLDFVGHREYSLERLEQLREANEHPPKLDEYPMPDGALPTKALAEAGCVDPEGLIPMCKDQAKELFSEGYTIFVIDENGDPQMCIDDADINNAGDRLLALEKDDWEKSPVFRALVRDRRLEHQAEREAAFMVFPGDAFAIYQVGQNDPQWRDRAFTNLDTLREYGLEPAREHYDLIYTGANKDHPSVTDPEAAFQVFNLERPSDFGGHSLSVSDIVALRHNGVVTYHYCDSIGFTEIPDFQKPENYLKAAEMAMEDDYGMIDGIINNGSKDQGPPQNEQPGASEQRPSVQNRLRELQAEVKNQQSTERERLRREERKI